MTQLHSPCQFCRHVEGMRCPAFPEGIPPAVAWETFHATPVPGQVGALVYTPVDGAPPLADWPTAAEAAAALVGVPDG